MKIVSNLIEQSFLALEGNPGPCTEWQKAAREKRIARLTSKWIADESNNPFFTVTFYVGWSLNANSRNILAIDPIGSVAIKAEWIFENRKQQTGRFKFNQEQKDRMKSGLVFTCKHIIRTRQDQIKQINADRKKWAGNITHRIWCQLRKSACIPLVSCTLHNNKRNAGVISMQRTLMNKALVEAISDFMNNEAHQAYLDSCTPSASQRKPKGKKDTNARGSRG